MKKYFQITVVLGIFGLLVFFRQFRGHDAQPVVSIPTTPSASDSSTGTQNAPTASVTSTSTAYKNGTYTGSVADAFYGNIQVQVTIAGGKIADVQFLQSPNDNGTSRVINSQAAPLLRQEALTAQSAHVDIVSGASDSSQAFQQSLSSALQQAQ